MKLGPDGKTAWGQRFGGAEIGSALAFAVDGQGRVAFGVGFVGSLDLGLGPLGPPGGTVVAVLDERGVAAWNTAFVGVGAIQALAFDAAGDLYAAGVASNVRPADFGGGPLEGAWLVKLDAAGHVLWSRSVATTGAAVTSIAFDACNEAVALVGRCSCQGATAHVPGGELPCPENGGSFFVKVDAAGAPLWGLVNAPKTRLVLAPGAVDAAGFSHLVREFQGDVALGGAPASGAHGGFLIAKVGP